MTSLEQDAVMSLERAAGTRLTVHAGRVWITESGWPDDVFLERGQHYLVTTPGRVVVEALGTRALLDVSVPGAAAAQRTPARGAARWRFGLARRSQPMRVRHAA